MTFPPTLPVGSTLAVGASAFDFSANRATRTPPSASSDAGLTTADGAAVRPGDDRSRSDLSLSVAAADNRGVSAVDFYVDGVQIPTDTQAPYAATFAVPAGFTAGRALQLEARATDFAGLEGTDSRQTQVVAATSLAHGVIAGEVYRRYDGSAGRWRRRRAEGDGRQRAARTRRRRPRTHAAAI